MGELLTQFKDKQTFDRYFVEHFIPMIYEDVKEGFEALVKKEGLDIFHKDYIIQVNKEDYKKHLSQAARFEFENTMTEAFYEKNPDIYEVAFGLYEEEPKQAAEIADTFHRTYQTIYEECLDCMFDSAIVPLLNR